MQIGLKLNIENITFVFERYEWKQTEMVNITIRINSKLSKSTDFL